jgi:Peptidase A4 family
MQRALRGASRLALVAGIGGALMFGLAGTAVAKQSSHARFVARARAALIRYLKHNAAPELAAPAPSGFSSNATNFSFNWSGYTDTSTTHGAFSRVSGTWTTPKVVCTAEDTITSEWVGIDGATDTTVEQDGTIGWCFEDKPTYFTWYEMYPAGTIEVGKTLQPGDKITAVVARTGTTYKLTVVDSTRSGDNVSKTATCAATTCLATSDEWIAERSSFSIGIAPLADYGTWTLSSGAGIKGGKSLTIAGMGSSPMEMVDATDSYLLDSTTALTSGDIFTTKWLNSY